MPEALDVTCPCCGSLLKVDPETGAVVWTEKRKEPAKDFDELVTRVRSHKSTLDEKFQRSVQQTKHQKDILDKKKPPVQDFDDLVNRVHSQKSILDEKFARSVQQTRNQKDILEKKFEEARKRAVADPTGRPPNPFDNE